ncbi:MAG: Flp family type IVb pilin [Caulobacteraceae bacterium]
MGEARPVDRLSDAASGPAASRIFARLSLKRFLAGESGATAIEYALLAAMMCVVTIAAIGALTPGVGTMFGGIADAFPDIS